MEKCFNINVNKAKPMSMIQCLNSVREQQQQQQEEEKNQDKYIIHIYKEMY